MKSRIVRISQLANDRPDPGDRGPDFILAFLPPSPNLEEILETVASRWRGALLFGCEAVTQFAGDGLTTDGTLHLFTLDDPSQCPAVEVVEASHERPIDAETMNRVANSLGGCSGALLICDGLRFPTNQLLSGIRDRLGPNAPIIAGGLASQSEPIDRPGARVFYGRRIYDSAAMIVAFRQIRPEVAIVRGWQPASPVFTVTSAEGNVVYEIDEKPAAEWYRQFFEVDGEIAPMPLSAHRFPLIIEGPKPDRAGLYRSMKFFNDPPGAVSYWGEIEKGDNVRLGMGDGGSLIEGAAALDAVEDAEAAILFSCVGREMVLGDSAPKEIETIQRALGVPLSGFFSFAEIGPSSKGILAFYNQTAVLVLLRESAA